LYDIQLHVRTRRERAPLGTVAWLMGCLKAGRFTSVGSYPTYFLTSDGATLSHQAVRDNLLAIVRSIRSNANDGWRVCDMGINWENPGLYCEHIGDRIESAYAEHEADPEEERDTLPSEPDAQCAFHAAGGYGPCSYCER
jgi:hypothetical protein